MILIDENFSFQLKPRKKATHKMHYGKNFIIAGSQNMMGAALLACRSAYRTGSGLVKLLTHSTQKNIVFMSIPEVIVETYEEHTVTQKVFNWSDATLIGPGLSQDNNAIYLVKQTLEHCTTPLVIDADALNIVSRHTEWFHSIKTPTVITPHIGEMSRLTHLSHAEILAKPLEVAQNFAKSHQITVVLKSHETIIASENHAYINKLGNPGMATAGSGDVLAGILVSLLGQGYLVEDAASKAVALHSAAGDIAALEFGEHSLMASDIINCLPKALLSQQNKL